MIQGILTTFTVNIRVEIPVMDARLDTADATGKHLAEALQSDVVAALNQRTLLRSTVTVSESHKTQYGRFYVESSVEPDAEGGYQQWYIVRAKPKTPNFGFYPDEEVGRATDKDGAEAMALRYHERDD